MTHDSTQRPWMELDETLLHPRDLSFEAERPEAGDLPEWLSRPGRRRFLKAFGVGAAAALSACSRLPVKNAMPYLVPPEEITPGVNVHYASTCSACPAACGLLVTVRDGRPVKLEGKPDHPLSAGGLCAVGQADIRGLYDPERLQHPTISGRPAAWDDVDATVMRGLESARSAGKTVYVLSRTVISPTARRAIEDFLAPYGGRLVEHDPDLASPSALREVYERLTGVPVTPAYDLEAVDLLVSLASDLLGTGPEPMAHAHSWAERRRQAATRGMPRHVQVESSPTLTGAGADERWSATPSERKLLSLWLLRLVAEADANAAAIVNRLRELPEPVGGAMRLQQLAAALASHHGRSLVISNANDATEQLAVALVNRLLGNEERTLSIARPSLVRRGLDRDLAALADDLGQGRVGALICVASDPVGELAGGEELAKQLASVPLSVTICDRPSATAQASQVVAAAHHGLECWGDAEPRPGLRTLAQPTIRPLFDTRHPYESFLVWSGAAQRDWRHQLMDTWRRRDFAGSGGCDAGDFDAFWAKVVTLAASGQCPLAVPGIAVDALPVDLAGAALALEPPQPAPSAGLEIELVAEVARRDGSRAHIPWLRELPDPLTRCSWAAVARVAPARARKLSLRDGDVVDIVAGKVRLSMPVRVHPGQHPSVIGVPIGYGRVGGDGGPMERNGLRLAPLSSQRRQVAGLTATLSPTGTSEVLPLMQIASRSEGRPIVHQVARETDVVHLEHHPGEASLWPATPRSSPHWEMVIDLDACTGCSACVVACQVENNIPVVGSEEMRRNRDMYWLRIDRYYAGSTDDPEVLFEPMLCAQCDHAPCETVCPVAATVHSVDGLNQQVYNRCVGTRYCANNCPYKARRFNWFDKQPTDPLERMVLNPDVVVRSRGVMEKCTFCVQRIQAARIAAKKEGRDHYEVVTACQQTCPTQAIVFGDGSDPAGPVAKLRAKQRTFQVLADLGIEPSITYLAKVRGRADGEPSEPTHGEHA